MEKLHSEGFQDGWYGKIILFEEKELSYIRFNKLTFDNGFLNGFNDAKQNKPEKQEFNIEIKTYVSGWGLGRYVAGYKNGYLNYK